jgi:acyl transferase domain-containing protein
LDPSILFEHNTLRKLAGYLAADFAKAFAIEAPLAKQAQDAALASRESATVAPSRIPGVSAPSREDIAVVGLSCRLPGAPNYTAYWNLLRNGATAIARGPQGRWESDAKYFGGWLEDIDAFDASFFNLKDSDARVLDPQTRLLLEESLSAIYDAGYEHPKLAGRKIGVYIGARSQGAADPEAIAAAANPVLGLAPNYVATSISRFFDFRGPSSVVDTACSSAITGLSFAADALLAGRIEMALIGAVNLLPTPAAHEMFNARGLLSPSGEVRLFDRRADGEVLGEGGGVVIVKRLSDAIRDGNRIYAVVKSIALNNDGRTLGPGSPNVHAQRELLTEALAASGRRMEDVGYIEVSGNGSPVVDAVELRALTDIYKLKERALGTCYLGSIKPNIGHLLLGSGLAAFVRCVLSVHRREIPPFLAAREPFEFYDFSASRIEFNRETISWALNDERPARVAALSSFPDGGTNGHVIIEEFTSGESHVQRLHAIQPPTLKRKPLRESAPARAPERDLFPESAAALTLDLAETLSRFARSRTPASLPEELDFYW